MLTHKEVVVEAAVLDGVRSIDHVIAVDGDGKSGLRAERAAHGIAEADGESLRAFDEAIVNNENGNGLGSLAGREEERAARGHIVRALTGRAVSARIVNRGRAGSIARARDRQIKPNCLVERF